MNSSSSWSAVLSFVYGANQLLWVAAQVTLLVVIATVVRRHRPDAYRPLLAWSIVGLVFGVVGWIAAFAMRVVMARDGIDAVLKTQAATGLLGAVEHVILVVLLIRGLVALAQPPKTPVTPGQPPYR
jgi:hypothetical protein